MGDLYHDPVRVVPTPGPSPNEFGEGCETIISPLPKLALGRGRGGASGSILSPLGIA